MDYAFDRFLRYDELVQWLESKVAAHPDLISVETYGQSHEGRDLLLATITALGHTLNTAPNGEITMGQAHAATVRVCDHC